MNDKINKDNIDGRIENLFLVKYMDLYERGEITEEQLQKVGSLIENMEEFEHDKFIDELKNIFPEDEELQQM